MGNRVFLTSTSGGPSHELTASLNSVNTNATITLPDDIQPGSYNVTVFGEGGTQDTLPALILVAQETILSPQIPEAEDFGGLIESIFRWGLALVGAAIFVNFLWAGFLWFTAAGRTGPIGQAKEKMFNALIGAIILLASYIILNTINPDLVQRTFTLPGL